MKNFVLLLISIPAFLSFFAYQQMKPKPIIVKKNRFKFIEYTYENQKLNPEKARFISHKDQIPNSGSVELWIDSVGIGKFKTKLVLQNTSTDTLSFYRVRNTGGHCIIFKQKPNQVMPDSNFVIFGAFDTRFGLKQNKRSNIEYRLGNNQAYRLFIRTRINPSIKR